jgi:hypothetical protein
MIILDHPVSELARIEEQPAMRTVIRDRAALDQVVDPFQRASAEELRRSLHIQEASVHFNNDLGRSPRKRFN